MVSNTIKSRNVSYLSPALSDHFYNNMQVMPVVFNTFQI